MGTIDILKEINKLPLSERLYILEKTIQSLKGNEEQNQMMIASEALAEEYKTNKELTAFTNLDIEDFYETK